MPIYIDVSSAVHSKAGIGRYAQSLAQTLVGQVPGSIALFYNRVGGSQLPAGLEGIPARTIRAGYKPWRMAVWLGQLARVSFQRLMPDAELFHATEHLLPNLGDVPTVLTVHDMIFRLFPEHQKRQNYWYLNATMPLYCRRADFIITVSESSKRDIVQHYELDPTKVHVIYEAASPEFVPGSPQAVAQVRQRYGLPERFALHVGTIEPRKNLTRLVEALQRLREKGVVVPLVVVGGKGWLYDAFFQRLEGLEVRHDTYFPGYVAAQDLPAIYSAAALVVVPSVYEGFGLPVLEAMSCGVPVVCSDRSSLPEVGGESACYFDPYDVEAIAEAIGALWTRSDLAEELGALGRGQAAKFSWQRAAEQTVAVYEKAKEANRRT